MTQLERETSQSLLPIVGPRTFYEFIGRIATGTTVDTLAAQGQRKMEAQNPVLLAFLVEQGEAFKRGVTLGYYLLWAESIKKGSVKLPTVQQDTIFDRVNEATSRPDETTIYEDSNEDPRYEDALAVLLQDENSREALKGAIAVRDLLRAEAEKQRINRMLE